MAMNLAECEDDKEAGSTEAAEEPSNRQKKKKAKKAKKSKKSKKSKGKQNDECADVEDITAMEMPEANEEMDAVVLQAVQQLAYVGCVMKSVDMGCYKTVVQQVGQPMAG